MPKSAGAIPRPPHAYVPGQNSRHPEDWFDAIKNTVGEGMRPEEVQQTQAFRAGLVYLETGFYWECHEVLEAVWARQPEGSPEKDMVQALIQLANARLKVLMQRPRAAVRLCDMVLGLLGAHPPEQAILGIKPMQVRRWVDQLVGALHGR